MRSQIQSLIYIAAISACEKGEQWQQAVDLFVAEQSVELCPDVIVFRALQIRMFYPPLVYISVTTVCKLMIFH